jgi:hypothetical protein
VTDDDAVVVKSVLLLLVAAAAVVLVEAFSSYGNDRLEMHDEGYNSRVVVVQREQASGVQVQRRNIPWLLTIGKDEVVKVEGL